MFALDILENHIHVLELRRKDKQIRLHALGDAEFRRQEEIPAILKTLMQNTKPNPIISHEVALTIPEEETFIKVVPFPKEDPEKLKIGLEENINKILPYAPEEVYWDWRIADRDYQNLDYYDIVFVATEKKFVDSYIKLLEEADLQTVLIETEANALLWGALHLGEKQEHIPPTLLANFGFTKTTIVIFAKGAIQFTKSAKMEGAQQKQVLTEKNLERVANQMKEYIEYYEGHTDTKDAGKSHKISNIIITGNWATFPEFFSFLEKKLHLPVSGPPNLLSIKPSYTIALGLALRGLAEDEHHAYL